MKTLIPTYHHDIQLKSIRLLSLSSSVSKDFNVDDTQDIVVDVSFGNIGKAINSTLGNAYLKTRVEGVKLGEVIFEIESVYEGTCISDKEIQMDEFNFFLKMQAIPMLWSYARETINNTMQKMNLNPVLLPVLNISEMMSSLKQSKDSMEEIGDVSR